VIEDRYYLSKVSLGLLEQLTPGRLRVPARSSLTFEDRELVGLTDRWAELVRRCRYGGWVLATASTYRDPDDDPPAHPLSGDGLARWLMTPSTAQAVADGGQP
jgi:hypothetical protein